MTEQYLLNRLKEEQVKYSVNALRNPGDKGLFDFGSRVGFVAGLEHAIAILLKAVDEENSKDL